MRERHSAHRKTQRARKAPEPALHATRRDDFHDRNDGNWGDASPPRDDSGERFAEVKDTPARGSFTNGRASAAPDDPASRDAVHGNQLAGQYGGDGNSQYGNEPHAVRATRGAADTAGRKPGTSRSSRRKEE